MSERNENAVKNHFGWMKHAGLFGLLLASDASQSTGTGTQQGPGASTHTSPGVGTDSKSGKNEDSGSASGAVRDRSTSGMEAGVVMGRGAPDPQGPDRMREMCKAGQWGNPAPERRRVQGDNNNESA